MQAVLKYLRGAAVGAEISIEFEEDQISLDIPPEGTREAGWAIKLVTPPVVRISFETFFAQNLSNWEN